MVRAPEPPAPVASVTVSLSAGILAPGEVAAATAVLRGAEGQILNERRVEWSIRHPGIASVGPGGEVTAVAPGTSEVIATCESVSGSAILIVPGRPMRMAIIADTHVGVPASKGVEFAGDAVATMRAREWVPDALAIAGDVVFEQTSYGDRLRELLAAYRLAEAPRVVALGNHDVNSGGLNFETIRSALPPDASSWLRPGRAYGSTNIGGVHVVVLDTTFLPVDDPPTHTGLGTGTDNYLGYVPREEREWLRADLAATTLPVVMVLHQWLVEAGATSIADLLMNRGQIIEILQEHRGRIAAVVSGHMHRPLHVVESGIPYFSCNAMYLPGAWVGPPGDRGTHAQLEVDSHRRTVRWAVWENDSIAGYREVDVVTAGY